MKTQRNTLLPLLEPLKKSLPTIQARAKAIQTLVDQSQHRPPRGTSDGTVDLPLWFQARDVASALRVLAAALNYTPCPNCRTACATWVVRHSPCAAPCGEAGALPCGEAGAPPAHPSGEGGQRFGRPLTADEFQKEKEDDDW